MLLSSTCRQEREVHSRCTVHQDISVHRSRAFTLTPSPLQPVGAVKHLRWHRTSAWPLQSKQWRWSSPPAKTTWVSWHGSPLFWAPIPRARSMGPLCSCRVVDLGTCLKASPVTVSLPVLRWSRCRAMGLGAKSRLIRLVREELLRQLLTARTSPILRLRFAREMHFQEMWMIVWLRLSFSSSWSSIPVSWLIDRQYRLKMRQTFSMITFWME